MPQTTPLVDDPDAVDRQQKRRLAVAYGATLIPLLVFGYLTWQSVLLNKQVQSAEGTLAEVNKKIVQAETDLATVQDKLNTQRQTTKHYRDMAGIKVRFYRESDRELVQKALIDEGFNVDASLGSSPLIGRNPNTLAYGSRVSETDLREIAVALLRKDFPLKRIAPAVTQPDPRLIQIYASAESDNQCGVLAIEDIQHAPFQNGQICGSKK